MKFVLVAELILCFCIGHHLAAAEKGNTLEKIDCVNVESLCANLRCSMTRISRFVTNITVGCTLVKPITKLMVRLVNYEKMKDNKYRKNLFDQTLNFCEIVNGASNPLVRTLLPNLPTLLGDLFRPCPISGELVAKNVIIDGRSPHIHGHPLGYRTTIVLLNEKLKKVFTLVMLGDVINED